MAGGGGLCVVDAIVQMNADIAATYIASMVDRQMTLEAEAQRDDWHGQVMPRIGPIYLTQREMYE